MSRSSVNVGREEKNGRNCRVQLSDAPGGGGVVRNYHRLGKDSRAFEGEKLAGRQCT